MRPLALFLLISGCMSTVSGQKQGVEGKIFWLSGNQMPGPGKNIDIPQQGVVRDIYIYKVTYNKDVIQTEGFFTDVKTDLIAKTTSSADGSFKVKLLPGEYSLFVKEPLGLFANLYDQNGKINPVVVKTNKYTWITVTVDYQSAY